MKTDAELLTEFAHTRSDAAFTELVRRHLDFVYSAVIRQVGGDAHLAKDAAQAVFSDLARKAPSLLGRDHLGGWLYQAAHFAAAKLVRAERRRREFEQEASAMSPLSSDAGEPDWAQLRGVLDAAMRDLSPSDRDAVLLRFFHRQSFAQIGEKFSVPEDTARKRVERALEKLHGLLANRGISSTAAGLGVVLAQNSIMGAPPGLAPAIASQVLDQAVAAGAASLFKPFSGLLPTKSMVMLGFVATTLGTGAIFYESQSARAEAAPAFVVAEPIQIESVAPPYDPVVNRTSPPRREGPIQVAAVATSHTDPNAAPPSAPAAATTASPPPSTSPVATAETKAAGSPSVATSAFPASTPAATSPAAGPIEGPHVMYIQQDKSWRLVADVERDTPFILVDGKREPADSTMRDFVSPTLPTLSGNGYALRPVKLFVPAVIQVDNVSTRILAQQVDRIVKTTMSLSFHAGFTPSASLQRVFLALEVISKTGNHRFYLHELGDLPANETKYYATDQVFEQGYEPADYKIRLFSGGVEVMHSAMPPAEIEHGLDDLVAFQLQHNAPGKPLPLVAPPPIYPAELREKKVTGKVVVTLRVKADGRVENPTVTESSQPEFATAALTALSRWRFVPAVKDGKPVATKISLPIAFAP